MRVEYPGGVRQAYYDRNAVPVYTWWSGVLLPPHALTMRYEYITPAGKKACIESIFMQMRRNNIATTPDMALIRFTFQPSGGTEGTLSEICEIWNLTGEYHQRVLSNMGFMDEGDAIRIYTSDISTDGNVSYYTALKLVEFSA